MVKYKPQWEAYRSFAAEIAAIPEFLAFIENALENAGCPQKRQMRFALAAEEIFANIALYAYADKAVSGPETGKRPDFEADCGSGFEPDSRACTIDALLQIFASPEQAVLRLSDSGKAFNPLECNTPDITLPPEERSIGGLGVFLAEKYTDSMEYERCDGRNILTLKILFDEGNEL
jgi:anti-sigma regulatory factor (Ser/Thr protein kinase)